MLRVLKHMLRALKQTSRLNKTLFEHPHHTIGRKAEMIRSSRHNIHCGREQLVR